MNYNSIEEILAAGTSNMTVIRNNSRNDESVDQITGVSWFTFNGVTANTVYASGNSWLGFGSSSEHLRVNRRDGALYSLYREEGTLFDYFKFLKIRWQGYSRYNYTSSSYSITYDVILWDTGDISLHMVNIPTSYNTGTYSLTASSTYSYSVSTSSPDVTFTKTDNGFTVSNTIIDLQIPYEIRYLVRSGSDYYTVKNSALSKVSVSKLTSNIFLNHGTEEVPPINLMLALSNPELLYWSDGKELESGLKAYITPPLPQTVYSEVYTTTENQPLAKVEIAHAKDILVAITFDDGQSWKYFDGTIWRTATAENEGMSTNTLASLQPEQWTEAATSTAFQFRAVLLNADSQMGKIYINLAGPAVEA